MTAQRGKDMLLKLDDGTGNFVTVPATQTCRSKSDQKKVSAAWGFSASSRPLRLS